MGQKAHFYIAGYPVLSEDHIDRHLLALFEEDEISSVEDEILQSYIFQGKEVTYKHHDYILAAKAKHLKDRLEVRGFTMSRVANKFVAFKNKRISDINEILLDDQPSDNHKKDQLLELDLLKQLTFAEFLKGVSQIIQNELRNDAAQDAKPSTNLIRYLKRDLGRADLFEYYEFCFLRALLECVPGETEVRYDITELVDGDFFDPSCPEEIFEQYLPEEKPEEILREKIIILTEGSSDIKILQTAMKVLYPHLLAYYSFMDFELSNAGGGASALVTTLKAFVGSGIRNRIIALFDNDTAVEVALKPLKKIEIPTNIKVIRLPNLALCEQYPTVGPNGISKMNINGLAVSMELFLGQDVLKNPDGEFVPVHWKGFDQSVSKYQGELMEKSQIQQAYFEKAQRCTEDQGAFDRADWIEMDQLLKTIFDAFNADNDLYFETFLDLE